MNELLRQLAERIRGQVPDLESTVHRVLRAWSHLEQLPADQDAYVDSVALNLHGFYSGLERLFELVARHVDGMAPGGETWHRDLLRQISQDVPDVRPAVISVENAEALDQFRRFRHLVRNVYTFSLVPARMAALVSVLPGLWSRVRAELLAFSEYLDDLARAS